MGKHLIRKAAALSLALGLTASALPLTASADDQQYIMGDMDLNGRLNAADLTLMKNLLIGAAEMSYQQMVAFDLSADGTPDLRDPS